MNSDIIIHRIKQHQVAFKPTYTGWVNYNVPTYSVDNTLYIHKKIPSFNNYP